MLQTLRKKSYWSANPSRKGPKLLSEIGEVSWNFLEIIEVIGKKKIEHQVGSSYFISERGERLLNTYHTTICLVDTIYI